MSDQFWRKRKPRKQEVSRFIVVWFEYDKVYFQLFKRDCHAVAFQQRMVDAGIAPEDIRILMR